MKQLNLKSDRLAALLDELVAVTGESKVAAVTRAIEQRLASLAGDTSTSRTLTWLESRVWSVLPPERRGKAPTKEEQEELLGF